MIEFLLKVWGLARPYRTRLFLGVVTGIVCGFIEPLMIATIVFVYSSIFPSADSAAITAQWKEMPDFVRALLVSAQQAAVSGLRSNPVGVMVLVSAIPLVIFLRGFFSYLNIYFLQWAAIRAITDLRVRLFERLMSLSASFFDRNHSGELMSRVLNDTGALSSVISNMTAVMVKDPVTVASLLAYLLWQQPRLTLVSMVVLPVCMVPIVIYSRKVRRSGRAIQTHFAELAGVLTESFTGNRIIKAYNLEEVMAAQFRGTSAKFISHYMRIVRSSELPGPLLEVVGAIGVGLVFLYLVFQSGTRTSSGDFLKVILAIFSLYRPLKNLTRLHSSLEQARASSQRVFELLAAKDKMSEAAVPKPLRAAGAEIEFEGVEFAYGDKAVLHGIDLKVRPGELVALVGPSGSGKTTITNLLVRFYDPTRGSIRIGGVDIREVATRALRNQIAAVTQETVLFNDTIYKNIAVGRPGASAKEIRQAAKHAHALEFILEKPRGFDSVIGERGLLLSGGQRQRIAIARAILKDAPILILDEATSALDTESERAVQAALEELMKGRTTICIAHRLSTVQHADLIVVIEQGKIVEMGKHTELIERGGVYQKLCQLQFQ